MPLYDFKCRKCEKTLEKIASIDTVAITCDCGDLMDKQIGMPMISLDGTDPSLPGAYDKWARDRQKRRKEHDKKNR